MRGTNPQEKEKKHKQLSILIKSTSVLHKTRIVSQSLLFFFLWPVNSGGNAGEGAFYYADSEAVCLSVYTVSIL